MLDGLAAYITGSSPHPGTLVETFTTFTSVFVGPILNLFRIFVPEITWPKTVNPPLLFVLSSAAALFARLKKNCEVAEFGSAVFAMAIVPYVLLKNLPTLN